MAIKVTTTRQTATTVKILVYGESGVGKTRLIASAPKPVIISSEKKEISLKNFDIPVYPVSSIADLKEAIGLLKGPDGEVFETICLDSISDIAEMMLDEFSQPDEKGKVPHGMQIYGNLGREGTALIKQFRDIPGKNIYMIAKMTRLTDEYSGVTSWAPNMPGNTLSTGLPYLFDYVFPLRIGEMEDGTKYRYFQTGSDVQYIAKGDNETLEEMEEADLEKLFNKILGAENA